MRRSWSFLGVFAVALALAAIFAAVPHMAAAQAQAYTIDVIAGVGDPAPGRDNAHFTALSGNVEINEAGDVLLEGWLDTGSGISGMWLWRGGALIPVVITGDDAPGTAGEVFRFAQYAKLNGLGDVAFIGHLGLPSGAATPPAVWTWQGGTLGLVARVGEIAPGTDGETFINFGSGAGHLMPVINEAGDVVFRGALEGDPTVVNRGIWFGNPNAVSLLARTGQEVPGTGGRTYHIPDIHNLNNAGEVAFRSYLQSVDWETAIMFGNSVDPTTLMPIALTGSPAPGEEGRTFDLIGLPSLNEQGDVAFYASLDNSNTDNDGGIWVTSLGALFELVREGDIAPNTGGRTFYSFRGVSLNNLGDIGFNGHLDKSDTSNEESLWLASADALTLLAREGSQAPGTPGLVFGRLLSYRPVLNDAGNVAFIGPLNFSDLALGAATGGLWAGAPDDPQLVLLTGDTIEVAPGDVRTITTIGLLGISGVSTDGPRKGFNSAGKLALWVRFADYSTAAILISPTEGSPNQRPVAVAGPDQSVTDIDTVVLDGSASFDPEATALAYTWTIDGVEVATGPNPVVGPFQPGSYVIKLRVNDQQGASAYDAFVLDVALAPNHPPVANAGPNQTVTSIQTATLNGLGSSDQDGDTLAYLWSLDGLDLATGPAPTVGPFGVGSYSITLTVTDPGGFSSSDTMTLTVLNSAPVADAGPDQTAVEANTVALDGTQSFDPESGALSYTWILEGQEIGVGATPTVGPFPVGLHSITLTVTDPEGATDSDTMVLAVIPANPPPDIPDAILVPQDQPSIQAAIAAAVNGDTILVAPGFYYETLSFSGKNVTVTSQYGPELTVIDGAGSGPVVSISSGEGPTAVFDGFTVQNGNAWNGAGIYIASSSPTVTNNRIVNNTGCSGVGIRSYFASPLIQGNIIADNLQSGCSGGNGAGVYIGGASTAQVLDNIITRNVSNSGGGGVFLNAAGTPTIRGNLITENTALGSGSASRGGGIAILNVSDALIVGNVITGNRTDVGGGVYWLVPSMGRGPYLINNTIADNDAPVGSALAAAGYDSRVLVINNTLAAKSGQSALFCGEGAEGLPPSVTSNNAFAPQGIAYDGLCAGLAGIDGNISQDPLFADPANGNYRLGPNSPSIDAGDDTRPEIPPTDFDGLPRFFDGDNDGFATVDMGAFEFQGQPVANAGFDQTVRDFETASLDGSGSFDPLGGPLSYLWTLDGVEIAAAPQATVGPFAAGTYTFTLTVTDQDSNGASDSMVLTVLPPNQPPVADAGPDQTANHAQSVSLNGTGSSDPEGDALTYVWSLDGAQIATGPTPTVGPFAIGTYTITLSVTDIEGDSAADTMVLTVINEPPIANAGPDQSVRVLQTATLDGTGSIDPEDGPVTYRWTLDGAEIGIGPTPAVGPFDIGIYTITLTVTDQQGASGSAAMALTVLPPNEPPVADAGLDQTVLDTAFIYLNGAGSFDPDGSFLSYEWALDGTLIATGPFPAVGPFAVGTYTITLTVTDAEGASGSDTMLLTVEPAPPIAHAGPDQSVRVAHAATLDGTLSYDPTSGSLTYAWTLGGTEIATGPTPTVGPFDIGTYTITLTVTDQDGLTGSDSMILTVLTPNQPPVANAGADQTVLDGETAILDGSASFDPDGDIFGTVLTYAWSLGGDEIATGATPVIGPLALGNHTITLTVTDGEGASSSDDMTLTVHLPPVADAGPDRTIREGESAVLDGSGSFDPEGGPLTYLWTLDGTQIADTPTVTVTPSGIGLHFVTLTVTDQEGVQASDTTTVAVVALAQDPVDIPLAIRVPSDQPTIQSAIDVAINGDTVLVSPGAYLESIDFRGKAITVISEFGPEVTVIDGQSANPVVAFLSGEGRESILSGFTIQNGNGWKGGGIRIENSSPTIKRNQIVNNVACIGIGIWMFGGSANIQENTISNNVRSGCSGMGGGGIAANYTVAPQIVGNVISDHIIRGGTGGGIYLLRAGTPTIRGNVISGNSVTGISPAAEGGGLWIGVDTNALVIDNLFVKNRADRGAGIHLREVGSVLVNNTIANNDAVQGLGSAISTTTHLAGTRLLNNVLLGASGQTAFHCENNDLDPSSVGSNNVYSDQALAYSGICSDQTGINGNISVDPLLVDATNGDYRLQATSPLLDVGDNSAPDLPLVDLDGNGRVVDGDGDGTATVDIGAFEFGDGAVADAGPDQTLTDRDLVALDGSGSFDPDGGALAYQWSIDGTILATEPSTTVGPFAAGSHDILLSVVDAANVVSVDVMTLTVQAVNQPPVANAGLDQTANHTQTVGLDGSGSSDPEADPLTYVWSLDGAQIATGPAPTVGPFPVGTHTVTLIVTDPFGASATDTLAVTVVNEVPVADAGPDQTVNHAQTVALDGTGSSDPEGGVLTYAWSLDGSQIATGPTPTVGPFPVGGHTITLTVTDDHGASATDTMVVTVVNEAPVANAGPDQTANHAQTVVLDGSASDPEGGALSYVWSLGGSQIATGPTPTVGPFPVGSHTITLTVTDDHGASAADTMVVTGVNEAPVADAGPDQTANHAQTVALDGSASDPEGGALSYVWSLGGSQIATGPTPTVGPFAVGGHTITLTVTDDHGASAADTMVVTVVNEPPVANAGPDQTANYNQGVTLDGTGSADPEGGVLSYVWSSGTTQIATGSMPVVGPFDAGVHTITLVVTDDHGASAADTVVLTVLNQAPIADAGPDETANHAQTVMLDGRGSSDVDGTIVSHVWSLGASQIATGPTPTVGPFPVGGHTITLTVTDDQGASATDTMVVTVVNEPPVADAGPDQTANHVQTVLLDGSASDPEGGALSYVWSLGGSQIATGPTPAVGPFPVGSHTITLTVTDDHGASATDTLAVTVVNEVPVADAGPDQTVSFTKGRATLVTLDGSASGDPEGGIVSYVWSEGGQTVGSGETVQVELTKGVYTFTLTVTDDHGATASDSVVVTVTKGVKTSGL